MIANVSAKSILVSQWISDIPTLWAGRGGTSGGKWPISELIREKSSEMFVFLSLSVLLANWLSCNVRIMQILILFIWFCNKQHVCYYLGVCTEEFIHRVSSFLMFKFEFLCRAGQMTDTRFAVVSWVSRLLVSSSAQLLLPQHSDFKFCERRDIWDRGDAGRRQILWHPGHREHQLYYQRQTTRGRYVEIRNNFLCSTFV